MHISPMYPRSKAKNMHIDTLQGKTKVTILFLVLVSVVLVLSLSLGLVPKQSKRNVIHRLVNMANKQ